MQRKIRMGMVGGGRGAFIGAVHRMAANLDGMIVQLGCRKVEGIRQGPFPAAGPRLCIVC